MGRGKAALTLSLNGPSLFTRRNNRRRKAFGSLRGSARFALAQADSASWTK